MYHAFNLDDALDKDNPENEWNSKFSNNLSQDTLEGKGSSRIHLKFSPLSFSKKTKSKHPKILFYGHFSSIKNKFESVQDIIQNTFDISSSMKLKLIPSQATNLVSRSTEFFERIVMHMGEDYLFRLIKT